jgi:hypothetical protein
MFWIRAYPLRGQVGWSWALEIENFLGPVKWHRADRRVHKIFNGCRQSIIPDISQEYKIGDMRKGVANTLKHAKKILKEMFE